MSNNPKEAPGGQPEAGATEDVVSQFEELGPALPEEPIEVDLESESMTPPEREAAGLPEAGTEDDAADPEAPAAETAAPVAPELEQRISELESTVAETRVQQAENRMAELEAGDKAEMDKDQAALDGLKGKMEAAYEKGDTRALADLNIESMKIVQRMTVRENTIKGRRNWFEQQKKAVAEGGGGEARVIPGAKAWMAQNRWFNDPRFQKETAYARLVDQQLDLEGFDKNSPKYYEELSNRVQAKFKEIGRPMQPRAERRDEGGGGPAPAVHQPSRPNTPTRTSGGKVVLTSSDFANMRRFGMDPKNKTHVVEYARNKRTRETTEARRG